MSQAIDLGHDHHLRFFCWAPDRDLNPQWVDYPDVPKAGALVRHPDAHGGTCESAINFDLPETRHLFQAQHVWQVQSWEPLTVSPSLLCKRCGDHGFIRGGKWVVA
jgi:hypothetical protein